METRKLVNTAWKITQPKKPAPSNPISRSARDNTMPPALSGHNKTVLIPVPSQFSPIAAGEKRGQIIKPPAWDSTLFLAARLPQPFGVSGALQCPFGQAQEFLLRVSWGKSKGSLMKFTKRTQITPVESIA